jgi:ribonuclease Z
LVELEEDTLLFDTGRGTTMQLLKQGVSPVDIDAIFITHHHYDHICDLGELLMAAWHNGRSQPVHVYGPTGTTAIIEALFDHVFARDIAFTHFFEPSRTDIQELVNVTDIPGAWKHESDNWRISAERVNHGNTLGLSEAEWLCLGYRLEANGKSLAIGGDAVACAGLSKLALNADALVLSCYLTKEEVKQMGAEEMASHLIATSGEVGEIATKANVQMLVLTHFRQKSAKLMQALVEEVQADFSGNLQIGEDLMVIHL